MDTNLIEEIRKYVYRHGLEATVAKFADQLATWPGEPAGVWLRVSSGGQDEANQLPDVLTHCATHSYRPARWYFLNDKSASKGEQQAHQDEAVDDMRDGAVKVLVCWHSDRLERRGPEYLFGLLRKVKDVPGNCRIESTREPLFGTEDLSGEAVTALGAVMAHQYSVHLSEQTRAGHDRSRANGAMVSGGIPWGYEVFGEKYDYGLRPTELGRDIVPQIFARCIAGDSCRSIALWLDTQHVPPTRAEHWSDASVWRILTNMTYAGRRQDEGERNAKGRPTRKNRQTVMQGEHCVPVITMATYAAAQEALRTRPQRGPGAAVTLPNRPLLASLKCARCDDSPMYRTRGGNGLRQYYYRCAGRSPSRHGCGNMVPMEATDTIVAVRIFMTSDAPYETKQWVEGQNWDAEIQGVKQDIREAADAERFDDLPTLQAKLAEYRHLDETQATKGHYEKRKVYHPDGTVMTVGEYFDTLDPDGQREYLKTRDIRVEKVLNPPLEPGATVGIRVVIDGEDHGVFPYPPRYHRSAT